MHSVNTPFLDVVFDRHAVGHDLTEDSNATIAQASASSAVVPPERSADPQPALRAAELGEQHRDHQQPQGMAPRRASAPWPTPPP